MKSPKRKAFGKTLEGYADSNQCPRCNTQLEKEEIWKDVSPYDSFCKTNYSIAYCPNEDCKIGKRVKENILAELDYWKRLADELGAPDLKYWQLVYDRSSNCFWLIVEDIWEEEEVGEPKHIWREPISLDAIGEAFNNRLANALTWDRGRGDSRFRELITKNLKIIAIEIKKDRKQN